MADAVRSIAMTESTTLCAIRHQDGSVSLYVDEAYAIERGVDPAKLVTVEIPRELYVSGSVQQIREYVATYLESQTEKPT
jgi:hypothetical protein